MLITLLCFLKWCIECFQWYLDTSCHVSRIDWKWTMTDNLYKKHECIRLFFHFLLVAAVMPLIHWVCNIGKVLFFYLTALNSIMNPSKLLDVLLLP